MMTSSENIIGSRSEAEEMITSVKFLEEVPLFTKRESAMNKINIKLKNLKRWRIHPSFQTLDFQIINSDDDPYEDLENQMRDFYMNKENQELFKMSPETARRECLDLGVVCLPDAQFKRCKFLHLSTDEEWEDVDLDVEVLATIYTKTTADDVDDVPLRFVLLDDNVGVEFNPLEMQLYYMVKTFTHFPCRTQECFLTDTELVENLNEFRDAALRLLSEEDIYQCTVDVVNDSEIPFVTLRSEKWEKTINRVLLIATVEALPKLCVPPVGEIKSGVTLSQLEPTGELFFQYKNSYVSDIFEIIVANSLTEAKVAAAKAKGPFEYPLMDLYISTYDGLYYRCKIVSMTPDESKATVKYIDYGNYEEVCLKDLVPCKEVDDILDAFAPQAVRAHLRNTGSMDVDRLLKLIPDDISFTLETVSEGTSEMIPIVELISQDKLIIVSEDLINDKLAGYWKGAHLPSRIKGRLNPSRSKSLIPKDTNWSGTSNVLAEAGAILDVYIKGVQPNTCCYINPVASKLRLKKLQEEIEKWYGWEYLTEFTDKEYSEIQWSMLEEGKDFLMQSSANCVSECERVRIIEDPTTSSHQVVVRLIDSAIPIYALKDNLHQLDPKFSSLPAQGAKLKLRLTKVPPEFMAKFKERLENTRFLVKVNSVSYVNDLCEINGDLYPHTAMASCLLSNTPGSDQSLSAADAAGIDLGMPCNLATLLPRHSDYDFSKWAECSYK